MDYKLKGNSAQVLQPVNFIENTKDEVTAQLRTFEEIVKFTIDPAEVARKDKECDESYSFLLNEISWKVKICRSDGFYDRTAVVELISNFTGDTETWSCEAEAIVKLFSPKQNGNTIEHNLKSFTYSKANPSNALKKFVKWDEMQENYTANGIATFQFEIKTKIPNRSPNLEQITTKFQVRAKKVLNLGEQYSNELTVHGIRWKVLTSKLQDNLAIFLCANENDVDVTKSWKASAKITLLHANKDNSLSKSISETILDWSQTRFGISDFMKWDEFTNKDKKYVQNNAVLFEIELNVQLNSNSK